MITFIRLCSYLFLGEGGGGGGGGGGEEGLGTRLVYLMPVPLNGVSGDLINARSTLLLGRSSYAPVSIQEITVSIQSEGEQ